MLEHRTSKLAALAALPLLFAVLSGCGASNEDSDSGGASDGTQSFEDYQVAFAGCMREQGIDMPDPSADGSMNLDGGGDPEAFSAAAETCQGELGQPPAPEGGPAPSDEERLADALAFAECLREEGYDVPDPEPGPGARPVPEGVPTEVLEACSSDDAAGSEG
ncbi:hypothetical protein [Marinactinospora rubrisoli]|uniref:Secreted protein n=1 Tax=Marinactinospora rubrisoli TaxID=2715399 RepID=A0ABW2KIZ2_9ACTN